MLRPVMLALAMSCLAVVPVHAATMFDFQGRTIDDNLMGVPFTGQITGSITFAPMPLVPGSTLGDADVVDFRFEIDGLVFDLANSSFFFAEFRVDTSESFSGYNFGAERELIDDGDGIEQISLFFRSSSLFEAIVVGDSRPGESGSVGDAAFISDRGSPSSGFTLSAPAAVPLPAPVWLLIAGMAGLGLLGRRRA